MQLLKNILLKHWWSVLTVAVLLATHLSGCSGLNADRSIEIQPTAAKIGYWIEVDIFSGQPNPRQPLEPTAAHEIRQRISELEPIAAAPIPDHLGYRGIMLHQDDKTHIRFYDGIGYLIKGDSAAYYHDLGRQLEKETLQKLQPWIDAELYQQLINELSVN